MGDESRILVSALDWPLAGSEPVSRGAENRAAHSSEGRTAAGAARSAWADEWALAGIPELDSPLAR